MKAKRVLLLLLVCALVLLAFAATATAKPVERPFKAFLNGEAHIVLDGIPPTGGTVDGTAVGNASHLGLTTATFHHPAPVLTSTYSGDMTLTAANGDMVFATYEGDNADFDPGAPAGTVITSPCTFEITGGTGRFAGAAGSGSMPVVLTYPGFALDSIWPATWTLTGTITY